MHLSKNTKHFGFTSSSQRPPVMEAIIQTRAMQVFIFHLGRWALGIEASPSAIKRLQQNSRWAAPKGRCWRLQQRWSWRLSSRPRALPHMRARRSPGAGAQTLRAAPGPESSKRRVRAQPSAAPLALQPDPGEPARSGSAVPVLPRQRAAQGAAGGVRCRGARPGPTPHGISPGRERCPQRWGRGFDPRVGRSRCGWIGWSLWVLPCSEYLVNLMDSCPSHRPMSAALHFLTFPSYFFVFYSFF